jgi:hypothetical protein
MIDPTMPMELVDGTLCEFVTLVNKNRRLVNVKVRGDDRTNGRAFTRTFDLKTGRHQMDKLPNLRNVGQKTQASVQLPLSPEPEADNACYGLF